jgi:hypothetical protein
VKGFYFVVTCVLLENPNKKRLSCQGGVSGVSLRAKPSFYLPGGFSATAVLPAPMFEERLLEEGCNQQVHSRRDRQEQRERTDQNGRFFCCFMPIFTQK